MKNAEVVPLNEAAILLDDRGLLADPRPTVDRQKLEQHLRAALEVLNVDLASENLRDTPRRWAESLVQMTSGYDYTDV
jgi:GTP cyclohydrolase I